MDDLLKLNQLAEGEAREAFLRCCGSRAWVESMLSRLPFQHHEALYDAATEAFSKLAKEDWLEAFSHHPKIGGKDALREKFTATRHWAQGEQAGAAAASEQTLGELARLNAEYEKKFGLTFIVCATGKSADEMLAILKERLSHDLPVEMCKAAGEQTKITKLRLEKLLQNLRG